MIRFLFLFLLAFNLLISPSVHAASCSLVFNNDNAPKSGYFHIPGSTSQIHLHLDKGKITLQKNNSEQILEFEAVETTALAVKIFDTIPEVENGGGGFRFSFSGDLTSMDAAILMRNLDAESRRRDLGLVEGAVGGGGALPPFHTDTATTSPEPIRPSASSAGGGGKDTDIKFPFFRGRGERYDFSKAEVRVSEGHAVPKAIDSEGQKFYQNFDVIVPAHEISTNSFRKKLEFIVRVIFGSRRAALEVHTDPKKLIYETLQHDLLKDATLRQAANDIIRDIRNVDSDWNAAIEGNDFSLVIILIPNDFG